MIRREPEKEYKVAVMFYHKDLKGKYERRWMDKCVASMENQSFKDYDVFELNYSDNSSDTLFDLVDRGIAFPKQYLTIYKPLKNHVEAMNYLLDFLFKDHNYDIVANTNLDDAYHSDRLIKEVQEIKQGYELVGTNFLHIRENDKKQDQVIHKCKFDEMNIKDELNKENNILCHPSIMYSREFWLQYGPYPDTIPREDLDLWKVAVNKGAKITIIPEFLTFYRRHANQICK